MVLLPTDPSKMWHQRSFKMHPEQSQLMANIYLYSIDQVKGLTKGETYLVKTNPQAKISQEIKLARLEYEGNWNPEPGGWRREAAVMNNENQTKLVVETVKLGDKKLNKDYKVAHLTGTGSKFVLKPALEAELVEWVKGGGTLIVDACGGGAAFFQSMDAALGKMFPDPNGGTLLKADDPILASAGGVAPAFTIPANGDKPPPAFRKFARNILQASAKSPQIRALEVNGRKAVFISREDLSTGLVGEAVDGINGYTPETASRLMASMVIYGYKGPPAPAAVGKPPTTAPAKGEGPAAVGK